jgi:GST-like protein
MKAPIILYGAKGGGSAIVEALLTLAGQEYRAKYFSWEQLPNAELLAINPLGEIPALQLADGTVLTETAAITLWLGDQFPQAGLVPALGDARRVQFLRQLIWLVAAVYPTFTYGDHPERYIDSEGGAQSLRRATDRRRAQLWQQLEQQLAPNTDWVCGDLFSALDIFIAVMSFWRPRREWFARECPKLFVIARRVDQIEALKPVWRNNGL